jgi:ATP-dependent DNA helicase RecG
MQTDIKFLAGVGPKKATIFNSELEIFSVEDLLWYLPFRYIDRSSFQKISQLESENLVQIKGTFLRFTLEGQKFKERLIGLFADGEKTIELVWFKSIRFIRRTLEIGKEYIVFGKTTVFNGHLTIVHPEIDTLDDNLLSKSTMQAVYSVSEKMKKAFITSKLLNKLQKSALELLKTKIQETLPEYLLAENKLISLEEAFQNIHFPQNADSLKKAQFRLKFDELFYTQLKILKQKRKQKRIFKGYIFEKVGEYFNLFYKNNLKFELTQAQKRVIKEIRYDLGSGKHMNRLLQGDVGSGKTLVALMTMLLAIDNGFQAAFMAPTEILASQHFETLTGFLENIGLNIKLLTGSSKTKERRKIHEELETGELHILVGTHALIEEKVQFKNLGIAIIDEQHRFGVAQRAKLWAKNTNPPHVLVMTATPIPRTLSMTLYGDLDISVIDELPPGRKQIKTVHAFDSQRLRVFKFMRDEISKGRQIYIVYPLIQESEKFDYKDLTDGYESITRAFPPPQYLVSIVHGQMKPEEKKRSMQLFTSGQAHILVSTTVIEVGVNVPNASIMIVESAEKFGLSQLRGRVGRGAEQSYCILMTSYKLSKNAKRRIQIMVESNDGFKIAEEDLKLRGPGDIESTQQSGLSFDFKIANIAYDGTIIQLCSDIIQRILDEDLELILPKNAVLFSEFEKRKKTKLNWRIIS